MSKNSSKLRHLAHPLRLHPGHTSKLTNVGKRPIRAAGSIIRRWTALFDDALSDFCPCRFLCADVAKKRNEYFGRCFSNSNAAPSIAGAAAHPTGGQLDLNL